MPLDPTLLRRMEEALTLPYGGREPPGPRLLDDARRLRARVNRLLALNLVPPPQGVEADALELACFALQFPGRAGGTREDDRVPAGRTSLRDRCEDAAELLI